MHHALVLSVFSSTFLVLTTLSGTTGDPGPQPPSSVPDDSSLLQAQQQSALISGDIEDDKRSWRDLQSGWGKRGWKDLHTGAWGKRGWKDLQGTGWGKRSWGDLRNGWGKRGRQDLLQNAWGKRAWSDLKGGSWGKRDWSQFRGGWGKRDKYYVDDQLPNLYDDLETPEEEEEEDIDEDLLDEDKRAWNNLRGQWGKRDWSSFRGSWGKRDPAWHNLKGLWGKRSVDSKWAKLQGGWGKRSVGGERPSRVLPRQNFPLNFVSKSLTHDGERMSTEIPIWVNGKIRWLSGIDKRTTCKDVVEVLLDGEGMNKSEAKDFAIMERWRKVERPLDENSKILRIWSHWGNEKREVRLCLRRIDNEVDSGRGSPILSGNMPSLRRKRNRNRGNGKPPWVYRETLHPRRLAELGRFTKKDYEEYQHIKGKQSEVNDDCEPLNDTHFYDNKIYYDEIYDKIHEGEGVNTRKKSGHKSYHCSGTGRVHSTPVSNPENHPKRTKCCSKRESKQKIRNSENIEKLMKLILAQGATIQSQLQKLKEREEQIESLEQERHRERIEKNGRNYLLETYLGSLKDAEVPEDLDDGKANEGEKDGHSQGPKERVKQGEPTPDLDRSSKIYGKTKSSHRREDSGSHSPVSSIQKNHQKSTRSRSESRNQESRLEGNLKRTLSDNAIAETNSVVLSDYEKDEGNCTAADNAKEEFEEVAELRRIQSQIEMWEKVFKINKKLEKEEENLVRLHIKIKKCQSENYRFAKVAHAEEATDSSVPEKENEDPEEMQYEQDCAEAQKNLETLRSDLEQNSKEIYQNFTKLIEEDEKVEQKRSCLSKLLTDLERTKHEQDMLNEMIEKQNLTRSEPESPAAEAQESTQSKIMCSDALSIPHKPQNNINQRAETDIADQEPSQPMKPKIVKISFEDKIQNYESLESSQQKVQPMPVPAGALKSILKNRKYNDYKKLNLSNDFQNHPEFSPGCEPNSSLQRNHSATGGHPQSQYIYPQDVTNPNYSYTIPLTLYDGFPHEHSQILGQPQLTEDLKTAYPMTNPHPSRAPTNAYPHSTMVTTKALIHNDTDSSTSSDTSGLSSMYSSSPTAEESFVEQGYVLDTLV